MSVLVVGMSHNSAPVAILEQVARDAEGALKLVRDVLDLEHVVEATVLSTCNRIEVYAEVDRFHGSVEAISRMILEPSAESDELLVPHLYVHYDDAAVSHLFHVASGLDSMVVGESQILGQTREALRVGQESASVGPALNSLFQQALRVGKRAHAETDIDRAGPSLVAAALDEAAGHLGRSDGLRALVLGAGSMASLAVSTLARAQASSIVVANRTPRNAARLATQYGGRAVALADAPAEIGKVDLVVSCTGATGVVLDVAAAACGPRRHRPAGRDRPGPAARRRPGGRRRAGGHAGRPRRPRRRPRWRR